MEICAVYLDIIWTIMTNSGETNISVGIIDRNGKNIQPDVFLKANDPSYLLDPK